MKRMNLFLAVMGVAAILAGCGKKTDEAATSLKITGALDTTTVLTAFSNAPIRIMEPLTTEGAPTAVKMKFYAAWVSPNEDCSAPVLVQDHGSTPVELNLAENPKIFEGKPADGTYKCLILKAVDTMKFTPDATAVAAYPGVCSASTEHTFDTYRSDSGELTPWKDIDGNEIAATGTAAVAGEDVVYYFASTNTAALASVAHVHQQIELASALVVPGAMTFAIQVNDSIANNGGRCWLEKLGVAFK